MGTVSCLSAGHGPILRYSATEDEVDEFPPQGLPLGFLPEADYAPPHDVVLAPGDIFMLLTDGFIEWTDREGNPFGIARIREFLRAHHQLGARDLIDRLHRDVVAFSRGVPQSDDLTAIVVRKTAP